MTTRCWTRASSCTGVGGFGLGFGFFFFARPLCLPLLAVLPFALPWLRAGTGFGFFFSGSAADTAWTASSAIAAASSASSAVFLCIEPPLGRTKTLDGL